MRIFRGVIAATCAVMLAVGCRQILGITDIPDAGDAATDALGDAPSSDAGCDASVAPDSGFLDDVTALALGDGFSCALQTSGDVWCWGNNDEGQLGMAKLDASATPTHVLGVSNATAISAGTDFACALVPPHVLCWGNDDHLQLGRDAGSAPAQIQDVSTTDLTAISASHAHVCALTVNQRTVCWGANDEEQSGTASNFAADASIPPTAAPSFDPNANPTLLAAGEHHTCAATADSGLVWCWGLNDDGQFGASASTAVFTPDPAGISFGAPITSLQANQSDTCVLVGARVLCAGSNDAHQVGNGGAVSSPTPIVVDVDGSANFTAFALGDEHSCFITPDGHASCVGAHSVGQLGNADVSDGSSPYAQAVLSSDGGGALDNVIGIAVGSIVSTSSQNFANKSQFHSCAIARSACARSGRVACWGANAHGQLGSGTSGLPSAIPRWVVAP